MNGERLLRGDEGVKINKNFPLARNEHEYMSGRRVKMNARDYKECRLKQALCLHRISGTHSADSRKYILPQDIKMTETY